MIKQIADKVRERREELRDNGIGGWVKAAADYNSDPVNPDHCKKLNQITYDELISIDGIGTKKATEIIAGKPYTDGDIQDSAWRFHGYGLLGNETGRKVYSYLKN